MKYRVRHLTTYSYADAVSTCHNQLHLHPRTGGKQICNRTDLTISPTPVQRNERWDYFGNKVVHFSIQEAHRELSIAAESVVQVEAWSPPELETSPAWEDVAQRLKSDRSRVALAAYQFAFDSHHIQRSDDLAAFTAGDFKPGAPILQAASALMSRLYRDFEYDPVATNVTTPVPEVLRLRRGVCQDFAHLMIAALRSIGLAARYVSGYLVTSPPQGEERLVGADASHAWVSVWCPDIGWVEFDPTNDVMPEDKHVTVAYGRDYSDVTPVRGVVLGGGSNTLSVGVEVKPWAEN